LVRMRTWHARAVFILGVALAHNIRTLMRQSLICFYMINSTNSSASCVVEGSFNLQVRLQRQ
ncbi:MAG: hypothetical protein QXF56_03310, partial [Candidatus Micrarchaeia archaeon]